MQVRDGHDRCHVAFDDEEDAEREAMKDRASDLTEDERELQRPLLNAHESGAQLGKERCPEPNLFAVVPNAGVLGVDFCLRPNVEPSHLSAGAKALLNPLDDLSPRPSIAGGLTMRRDPLAQEGLLPLVKGHLVGAGRDAVPQ